MTSLLSQLPKKETGPSLAHALSLYQQKHGQPPWSNDDKVKILVRAVKEKLGLRSVPETTTITQAWWEAAPNTPAGESGSRLRVLSPLRRESKTSLSQSAAALFLGPELSNVVS